MCGIVASISKKSDLPIKKMIGALAHRGPDDEGIYVAQSGDYHLALAQRRLAIIDLSPAGHQPMSYDAGTLWITYNGELYNFLELKKQLSARGHVFTSKTDTEVILAAYKEWGESCLQRLNGMFAFALWDTRERKLLLARDHMGQKPLYYVELSDGGILAASEIKAILASRLVSPRVRASALPEYLASLRVHAPDTMFEGIKKLKAAHALVWRDGTLREFRFWDPLSLPKFTGTLPEATERFQNIFDDAVDRHLVSDVPVGSFLSGGLDSSMITARAVRNSKGRMTTFTTGFSEHDRKAEGSKNELMYARRMRDLLGERIDYREIILEANVVSLLPKIIWHLEEPLCDPAAINAYLICEQARKAGITVLLSGMGADEIFGGYNHHLLTWIFGFQERFHVPMKMIAAAVKLLASLPLDSPHIRYLRRKGKFLIGDPVDRVLGFSSWLTNDEVFALMRPGGMHNDPMATKRAYSQEAGNVDLLSRLLYTDLKTFLADHNLLYTDKMSMAWSSEIRSPFLDRELVEFAFSLPSSFKIHHGTTKYIMKRAAQAYLPHEIVTQRKTGFAAPLRAWRTQIQELSREHLAQDRPAMQYFNASTVKNLVREHAAGKQDVSYQLWSLITFSLWHKIWIEDK